MTPAEAISRAEHFLRSSLGDRGIPPAFLSFDPSFTESFPGAAARRVLHLRTGIDVGFDLCEEAFTAMLALTLVPALSRSLREDMTARLIPVVERCRWRSRYRFFTEPNGFAADTDSTAVATAGLHAHGALPVRELARTARQLELAAARPGGVFMVYWEDGAEPGALPRGRKHDAVACANAVHAVTLGQQACGIEPGPGTLASVRYVADHLRTGRYRTGTRYYPDPEAFLYAAARLCVRSGHGEQLLRTTLVRELSSMEDRGAGPLAIAQRVLAADIIGAGAHQADRLRNLLRQQRSDGSWPPCPVFRMGRIPAYFGSPQITTLFAVAALRTAP